MKQGWLVCVSLNQAPYAPCQAGLSQGARPALTLLGEAQDASEVMEKKMILCTKNLKNDHAFDPRISFSGSFPKQ